ncbi:ABC transporter substrate-binding protein [Paenarthrobacter nitroguajacolicus]|uniref:ABC transporter substrate-binding protein n=1 Tax=Paenarthrobacter nitroguajacolicus TaxID=211146 RepID=UPI0015BA2189|nr:extracellular solute-binding protein [Paenarthrobacter nitroguajacolicus]NWL31749.1 sugar ABC transporter substrate-binding protein [Paenarthrobacter nitroguajacolicus]
MRKSTQSLMALMAGAALALTGCSDGGSQPAAVLDPNAEPQYTGTLSILTKFGGDPLEPYFEDLAAEYKKQHPEVSFDLIQETDQSIKDKTKTLTASQAMPDIYFTWAGSWANNFIDGGLAADLTPVIAPGTEWGNNFGESALKAFAKDGKYFAVPLYNNGKFMGYNQRIFKELGLTPPTTFDELISSCSVLKGAGYEPISFGNKDGWPGLHYLQQLFAYEVPAETLQADFSPETAKLEDKGYLKAMDQFTTLVNECTGSGEDSNGVLYTTAQQALAEGKSGMYYQEILEFDSTASAESKLKQDGLGIFKLPAATDAKGDPKAIEGSPEGYIINARSKNAALAADFMKFATNSQNAAKLSAPPYGQPSAVKGAVSTENSSGPVIEGIKQVNEASAAITWLDSVTVPAVADAWLAGGEALVAGTQTPDQVLASVRAASSAAK